MLRWRIAPLFLHPLKQLKITHAHLLNTSWFPAAWLSSIDLQKLSKYTSINTLFHSSETNCCFYFPINVSGDVRLQRWSPFVGVTFHSEEVKTLLLNGNNSILGWNARLARWRVGSCAFFVDLSPGNQRGLTNERPLQRKKWRNCFTQLLVSEKTPSSYCFLLTHRYMAGGEWAGPLSLCSFFLSSTKRSDQN